MPSPFVPKVAEIKSVREETHDVKTYTFSFVNGAERDRFDFAPGQFNMVSLPGIGEAPLSLTSVPNGHGTFDHTVRAVGRVTKAMAALTPGDNLGIRGPYGRPWPLGRMAGKDVIIVTGGTGIACVKPAIAHISAKRDQYGIVQVFYGARTTDDMVFRPEFDSWTANGIDVNLAVDKGSAEAWPYHVGVVTTLFDRLRVAPANAIALISGPDVMMRFSAVELLTRGFLQDQVYLTLERRMDCGIRLCGHCMLGPLYMCQDGPVFPYSEVRGLFGVVA